MLTYGRFLISTIFEQIHQFKRTQDILYVSAIEEYHKRQSAMEDGDEPSVVISPEARYQLNLLGRQYRDNFDKFNEALSILEIDQKSLSFRLDFNEFYKESRERDAYGDRPMGIDIDQLNVDDIDDDESEEEESEDEEEHINTQSNKGPSNRHR